MTVSSADRTALFIDGANLYSAAKALGFDIDYKRLLKEFQSQERQNIDRCLRGLSKKEKGEQHQRCSRDA
jgi:uncharacterized LabA/DUF88 family protein